MLNNKLSCPNCQSRLFLNDKTWRCANNHTFDVGKSGDVNLLLPQQKRSLAPGDSKEMVNARRDFLASGAYQPIAENIAQYITMLSHGEPVAIADAGCGEGYYLRQIQRLCYPQINSGAQFVGWDISKFAVQSAAKQADFVTWLTASNAHIPIADNNVDIVLSLFGFEVATEFSRILKREVGWPRFVITADAGERHLLEIREKIYPEIKPYREKPLLDEKLFQCVKHDSLTYEITLDKTQLSQLLLMTPHFFRAKLDAKASIDELASLSVTIDVLFRVYAIV